MHQKVLVFGGRTRSSLAVVRSLGRKGIKVHLGWYSPDSIVPFSRYTTKTHRLPEYREGNSCWLDALISLLKDEKFDLVIPTGDLSMLPLVKERSTLEKIVKIAIPSNWAFYCAYRKSETNKLAQCLSVPIPRQILVSNAEDFPELDSGWKFPLVIKPVSSKVIKGAEIISLGVSYANSKEELLIKLKNLLEITPALVEEYFVGTGMGVELLADEGEILCAFQHERIHEPMYGGGSTYRKSVPLNPSLLNCVERLFSALKWTGVAMVEFKYNKSTDKFVLLEINGRFWGSLPLAVAAGMDFPYYLYQLLVEGKKDFSVNYKTGIYCRNLYLDLGWFKQNLFTQSSKFNNALPFWKLVYEPLNLLLLRERSDTFVLDDLRPALAELGLLWQRFVSALHRKFYKAMCSTRFFKRNQLKKLGAIGRVNSIIFVCKGNICRSPFAETYAKNLLGTRGQQLRIDSCGYLPKPNRRCLDGAIEAGKKLGVDLSQHRSKVMSEEILSQFDIVAAFDVEGYMRVRRGFKRLRKKLLFLGAVSKKDKVEYIKDPYGKDQEYFVMVYKSIAEMVELFVQKVANTL